MSLEKVKTSLRNSLNNALRKFQFRQKVKKLKGWGVFRVLQHLFSKAYINHPRNSTNMMVNLKGFVKENFQYFKEVYDSEQEMLEYWKKFSDVPKPNKSAINEFYDISSFYKAMKLTKDDFIKLIMITSLVERLNSDKDHKKFPEWLDDQGKVEKACNKKEIKRLWGAYNEEFGCSSKFRNFFKGKYLTKEEKVTLLKSVSFYTTLDDGGKSSHLMPMFCYDKNYCYFREPFISCPLSPLNYNKDDCPICKDVKKLEIGLDEFAEFLYSMRNNFAHDAHMPTLAPPLEPVVHEGGATMSMSMFAYTHYKFKRRKKPDYLGWICIDLNVNYIEKILNRNFKKLLENYVEVRKA